MTKRKRKGKRTGHAAYWARLTKAERRARTAAARAARLDDQSWARAPRVWSGDPEIGKWRIWIN